MKEKVYGLDIPKVTPWVSFRMFAYKEDNEDITMFGNIGQFSSSREPSVYVIGKVDYSVCGKSNAYAFFHEDVVHPKCVFSDDIDFCHDILSSKETVILNTVFGDPIRQVSDEKLGDMLQNVQMVMVQPSQELYKFSDNEDYQKYFSRMWNKKLAQQSANAPK